MISLSTAIFPLTGNETSAPGCRTWEDVAVKVNAPELVKDEADAVVSSVVYNPAFQFSHIEHNIHTLPGIEGCHASDWLEFVTSSGESVKP